jgi:hypothetical protein
MRVQWRCAALGLLLLAAALPGPLLAQGFQGQLTAIIEDEQGAAVPGASVTVRNEKTGDTRTQVSQSAGTVVFPNLLVGTYTLTAELSGFKRYERRGIEVKSNQVVDVKARLAVGGVEETMTVIGGAELVKTTSSQLEGGTFSARQVTDLPVYDPGLTGDVTNFAVLVPGVGTQPGGMAGWGGVIGGNRPRNNSFVVDGLDNNEPDVTGPVATPIQDSVAEFQLITNQFSAEFGHSTAGQFVTATKSGTNELHGGIWEYNINRHLLSLDNLTRATAGPDFEKPRFDRNRFGGQLGGPIVKDKLFFYGAYEYQNLTQAGVSSTEILVPTASGLATLQALAANPATGISPISVGILRDHVPTAGTATDTALVFNRATGQFVPIALGPFSATTPNYNRVHVGQFNLDAHLGDHRLSGRGYYSRANSIQAGALPTDEFNSNVTNTTKRGTLSWVFIPRHNVINEFRAGYTDSVGDYPVDLPAAPGAGDVFANYALDDIGLEIGPQSNFPQTGTNSTLQIGNTTTWIRGGHTFKVGGEYRRVESASAFLPRARGEYRYESFDQFVRDQLPTGLALRGVGSEYFLGDRDAVYGFVQDTWRVTPRLTLDIGVRYEFTQVAKDSARQAENAISNVDIRSERNAAGQVIFDTLTPAHQALLLSQFPDGRTTFRQPGSDKNNFGPRVGFAWDIGGDGKSSLRGGFGIAHDVFFGNLPLLQLPPQAQVETGTDIACSLSPRPAWCNVPDPSASTVGFLAGGAIGAAIDPTTSTDRTAARGSTTAYVGDEVSPETYTWSLSYQRQLATDYVAEVRYIGTWSRKLPVQLRKNAGIPNPVPLPIFASQAEALSQSYSGAPTLAQHLAARTRLLGPYGFLGTVTAFDPVGESTYHGASVSLTRRFSNRFGFNVNYTLSRTEDNAENELFTSLVNPRRPDDFWDIDSNTGLSGLHKPHKVAASWQWEISKSKNKLVGGWVLSGAFIFETGQGLTVQSARDQNGDLDATGDRAWLNAANDNKLGTDTSFVCYAGGRTYISGTAAGCGGSSFVVGYVANDPSARWVRGREGAMRGVGLEKSRRGALLGPGPIHTLNLALYKKIDFGRMDLRLGVTCNNCTNTPSFALGSGSAFQSTAVASGAAGRAFVTPGTPQFLDETIFSGGLGSAPFQRIIQLEAKLSF